MKSLAITGSTALLEELSPFIPDDFINSLFYGESRRGQPRKFTPAQLYRATLLALLTSAHSFNLMEWLGLDPGDRLHWFGVPTSDSLCARCWQRSQCPQQFSFPPERHEILYGLIPLSSRVAQAMLKQVRPWIEATQSYEKNQLGLGSVFLNSLKLAWVHGLLADAVALLRARATLNKPPEPALLRDLAPEQTLLELER